MNWLGQLNPADPTWDLFVLLFFVIAVLLYGFSLGRDRVVVIMISIYMGLAVVTNAPYLDRLKASFALNSFAFQISAFIGVFLLFFFLLSRNALVRSFALGSDGGLVQTMLFSVLHVGLLLSVGLSFLPGGALEHLSYKTQAVFTSDAGRFAWLVSPIVAMMIFGGERKK
jgi:hypothetical protein